MSTMEVDREVAGVCAKVGVAMIADCLDALGADAGYVGTVSEDGETLEVARVTPYCRVPVRLSFPLEAPYPLAATVRERRPLFIANNEQLACDHPGLVRVKGEDHACATLPITAPGGEVLGAVNFAFDDPHYFTQEERDLIAVAGQRLAEAMTAAKHLEVELGTRATASSA